MVKIHRNILKQRASNVPGRNMTPKYITVHNTANPNKGADAEMHARYQHNGSGGRQVSWHYTVDDKEAWQTLEDNQQGWHSGDGSGSGNTESIGIEICENSDGDFQKAISNAQDLIKQLMDKHDIPLSNVVTHKHWSGKNCPRLLLNTWSSFKDGITGKSSAPSKSSSSKSISQMADEVEAQKHGNGHDNRRESLGISKDEYEKVRAEINRRAGVSTSSGSSRKSISQMADEVEAQKHGNGHENRRKSLGISKDRYAQVRAEVNRRAGVGSSKSSGRSIKQMADKIINDSNAPQGHASRQKWLGVNDATYKKVRAEVNSRF